MDTRFIDDLAQRLTQALPQGARDLQNDLEKNFRAVLQSSFAKLDLVTREEFEVQTQVLARTRSKLEALEKRVAEMENPASSESGEAGQ
ncbi:ubiquinone biosynthesis accessory factor UbiK [Thiohalomonas denitrificans]|uniref:Ubiquinone biosynthesis accessory factor UbiK n=1 Tax=Thiohalomonas denitrificans TaxID=415747 RepID=A0A1G5QYQ2_9GAMM|nr:accessory factor UbiK family protein [Thiohalomonas denitrificans]SCZ66994.1 hypothetical protein SAMN03097708_03061 [Thiohalomonas denitrificans]